MKSISTPGWVDSWEGDSRNKQDLHENRQQNRCAQAAGCGYIGGCSTRRAGLRKPELAPAMDAAMNRARLQIYYSGRVQGVGFRYTVKSLVTGFDVVGSVRNLPDGRVELIAEGAKPELEAFQQAVRDSGMGGLIADESVVWSAARGEFCGFEIIG